MAHAPCQERDVGYSEEDGASNHRIWDKVAPSRSAAALKTLFEEDCKKT